MVPNSNSFFAQGFRWLYIDFNSYFASVEQQMRPELRGKPVAVVPVNTDYTSAIAASYEAKAFGISTGTRIKEAKQQCPGLICVLANHERYIKYHHRILAEIDQHIPVTEVCSIDEVACRLMDNETSPERAMEIAHSIKRGLANNVGDYVRCSIGLAPNRYLAKVATDLQKPNGLTFLSGEDIPRRLNALALRDLPGVGYQMEKRLQMAGIALVSQLWPLNAQQMRKAWGSVLGERMWYYLRGVELQEKETTRSTLGHSHVLSPELRHPEKARYVARRLTLKAASRLRRIDYYASCLHVAMRLESGMRLEAQMRCYRAQDSLTFLRMLEQGWSRLLQQSRSEPIKKISISFFGLTASQDIQPELLPELSEGEMIRRTRAERMSRSLDAINQRYGRDAVSMGMLPEMGRSFSGTKIAFTRIPDIEEFLE